MIEEKLWRDIRLGARTLRKNGTFTLAAAVTLALGIGGTTAAFTAIDTLLLRPLPYPDPRHLVTVGVERGPGNPEPHDDWSLLRFDFVRQQSRTLSSVGAFTTDSANIAGGGEPRQVPLARVSPCFFTVLGVMPALGRGFTEAEGQPAGNPVILISDSLWHSRFGGNRGIVGAMMDVDSVPHTIVGVLPPVRFPFMGTAEIWSPRYFELSMLTPQHIRSGVGYLGVIARLRGDTPISTAAAEMNLRTGFHSPSRPPRA